MRAAVVTVSTTRSAGTATDESGPALAHAVKQHGGTVVFEQLVTDDEQQIRQLLITLADGGECNLILTTGGTGFSPSDVTPEATLSVIERSAPGIAEALRAVSLAHTPFAMLSRGVAGMRGPVLIVNFPGSVVACEQCFEVLAPVLDHALTLLAGGESRH